MPSKRRPFFGKDRSFQPICGILRPPPSGFTARLTREVATRRTVRHGWRRLALPKWTLIAASLAFLAGFVFAATIVVESVAVKGGGDEKAEETNNSK